MRVRAGESLTPAQGAEELQRKSVRNNVGEEVVESNVPIKGDYFSISAILAIPALAHASSLSPPGAPLTPTAPMTSLPALMGTPPAVPTVPSILGAGGLVIQALPVSAEVLLKVSAV